MAAERGEMTDPTVIALQPQLPELYRQRVEALANCLNDS